VVKYQTVGTVSKTNKTIVERGKIDIHSTHIHADPLSWLGTGFAINFGGG